MCFRQSCGKLFSIVCLPLSFCPFYSCNILNWYYYDGSPCKGISGTRVQSPLHGSIITQIKKLTHIVVIKKYLYIEDKTNKDDKPTPPRLQWKKNHWLCLCKETIVFPIILAIWPYDLSFPENWNSPSESNKPVLICQICMMSVLALFAWRLDKNCLANKASVDF